MGINEAIDVINERMGTTASADEMKACEIAIKALEAQIRLEDLIAMVEYEGCWDSVITVAYFLLLLNQLRL